MTDITSQDIQDLVSSVSTLASSTYEDKARIAVLENNQIHFSKVMDKLSESSQKQTIVFERLSINLLNLEERSLADISDIKVQVTSYPEKIQAVGHTLNVSIQNLESKFQESLESVEERIERDINSLGGKVTALEKVNENKAGGDKVRGDYRKFWFANWNKLLTLIVTLIIIGAIIYSNINGNPSVTGGG